MSEMNARGSAVLVVLRGYPGYQCPYCNRQVHSPWLGMAPDGSPILLADAGIQEVYSLGVTFP